MDFGGWSPARLLHAGLNSGLMCNYKNTIEYNIIQMLTQNLVEVGNVCGPGEKKFFFHNYFFLKL
jgi:hypothetical protein